MASLSATDIFTNFHGPATMGSQALSQAQGTSDQLAGSSQQQAADIHRLIDNIKSAWTGDAAEAASQGLALVAENLLDTGDALNTIQQVISQQVDAFHTAASKVRPVPPSPGLWNTIGAIGMNVAIGDPVAIPANNSVYDQVSAHDAVSNANIDAYNEYVKASQHNASSLPDLSGTLPDKIAAPVSVRPPARVAAPRRKVSSGPTAPRSSAGRASHPVAARSAPVGQGPTGVWTPPPSSTQPVSQPTMTQSVNPSLTTDQPLMPTTPPSAVVPPSDGGSTGWVFGDGGSISSRLGSGGFGPSGSDEPAARSGVLRGGAGLGAEEGRSGSAATEGRAVAGSAAAEEEALASGRGAGGMAGAPMAGRGGRREEDVEHRRRYTYDEDPDLFDGDLPTTPPPVIGA